MRKLTLVLSHYDKVIFACRFRTIVGGTNSDVRHRYMTCTGEIQASVEAKIALSTISIPTDRSAIREQKQNKVNKPKQFSLI